MQPEIYPYPPASARESKNDVYNAYFYESSFGRIVVPVKEIFAFQ